LRFCFHNWKRGFDPIFISKLKFYRSSRGADYRVATRLARAGAATQSFSWIASPSARKDETVNFLLHAAISCWFLCRLYHNGGALYLYGSGFPRKLLVTFSHQIQARLFAACASLSWAAIMAGAIVFKENDV
jgi:hypothetical protein